MVDMQSKLLPAMRDGDRALDRCVRLVDAARLLGIPAEATEQYPQGLGPTDEALSGRLPEGAAKRRFSAGGLLPWMSLPNEDGRHQVVVAGIEAHVCVLQTALDLIAAGFDVHVPADAVASRNEDDLRIALARLSAEGATVTGSESVLFEWCETSEAAEFKAISRMVTGR
ncbi:MAG: isochorismatase family protein [Planctomyces sp.]|nr:isochorismatase family protein [Planctomyces sp.]